mmetsp:Transcript_11324/g.15060  ORF Transcript_11324/g.15060 Transcript_11324/m.15060 type:complete len:183 (-) Transcript_11324:174-722(-)
MADLRIPSEVVDLSQVQTGNLVMYLSGDTTHLGFASPSGAVVRIIQMEKEDQQVTFTKSTAQRGALMIRFYGNVKFTKNIEAFFKNQENPLIGERGADLRYLLQSDLSSIEQRLREINSKEFKLEVNRFINQLGGMSLEEMQQVNQSVEKKGLALFAPPPTSPSNYQFDVVFEKEKEKEKEK